MEKLGAIAISSDIYKKANIGLWAFELDEGSAPRMYADETMMKLIGLDHEVSPEETYHAWYDHIDPDHYEKVSEAVEKMTSGTHAEVQYPWHHPNGDVWIVRCGGVRNYAYTKGIRIEGTHQNVTDIMHLEKEKLGTIALDKDILTKANIGLWAFELDEGSAPRMYADEAMMKLIGLDHEVSPEETYHAWYDYIDPEHYGEVAEAVEKMTSGTHAEVQYPWHHPNGDVWIVRCGGVRNYAYTKGIRIEGTHQNVTDIVHLEKKKLGTIALDKDILTKANIGLWAFELDEGSAPRMYADEAMMKLIGLDHEVSPEETYHAWYDYIDPEHYGKVAEAVEKMTSGIHAEVQYPWHCPCGETWIVRCGGVRNYAYTKGIRIEGTHQNISDLAHFEEKNLTDLLASLADNFLQVYFIDPYTGVFSSYAGKMLDDEERTDSDKRDFYQRLAERSSSIVHPDDKPLTDRMYSRDHLISVLESGEPVEFILRRLTENGTDCLYMKNRLVPFEDSDGTRKLVLGISDVTGEILADKALQDRNSYLEHFLKSFQSAYIVDLSNDTFEILSMNHEFRHVFQENGGRDAMNTFVKEHIHPDDRELMMKMIDREYVRTLLEKESEINFTVREVYGEIEKTIRVLIMHGADYSRAAVGFMDISDEIAKEKEHSRKLEAANRAKTAFLFNMSHDIRTPMNAIIGFTNMAMNHIDDTERVKDCLDKVENSSKHLLSLINDVLDMSRIESGKTNCEYSKVRISKAALDIVNMVRETSVKNLEFEYDFSGIKHDWVMADALHVNRIITNIIGNSVKYTNEGGIIKYTIQESPTDIENRYSYDFIISDTGIGMSEEFLSHLFEEFSRESTSTESGVEGTGLGMAITKKLVGLLGGSIDVKSKIGVGTTVTVSLELDTVCADEIMPEESKQTGAIILNGKRILLVEDNELNREISKDILEENGIIVDEAEDGDIAVEKMRNAYAGQYDLILMDIQMPRMNGYEATREIRKLPNPWASGIPILAITANAFEEDKQNAMAAGMNGHIAKPIDVYVLLHTLAEIFG